MVTVPRMMLLHQKITKKKEEEERKIKVETNREAENFH